MAVSEGRVGPTRRKDEARRMPPVRHTNIAPIARAGGHDGWRHGRAHVIANGRWSELAGDGQAVEGGQDDDLNSVIGCHQVVEAAQCREVVVIRCWLYDLTAP
jgi:hypothetical protein